MRKIFKKFESLVKKFIEKFWMTELKAVMAIMLLLLPIFVGCIVVLILVKLHLLVVSQKYSFYIFLGSLVINCIFYGICWIVSSKMTKECKSKYDSDTLERSTFWIVFLFFVYLIMVVVSLF